VFPFQRQELCGKSLIKLHETEALMVPSTFLIRQELLAKKLDY